MNIIKHESLSITNSSQFVNIITDAVINKIIDTTPKVWTTNNEYKHIRPNQNNGVSWFSFYTPAVWSWRESSCEQFILIYKFADSILIYFVAVIYFFV